MVGYYRLKETGFRLSAGAHILAKESVAPLDGATAILDQADAAAERIVRQARDAFEAERRRGYEEGAARARMEAVERLVGESTLLDRKLAELEGELAQIVVQAVSRLVESFDDHEKAQSLVRTALRKMRREKRVELRVSPSQYGQMRAAISGIIEEFPEIDLVDVVEDATLSGPQVIVETAIGRVEGDLGRNLRELEHALRAAAGSNGSASEERPHEQEPAA